MKQQPRRAFRTPVGVLLRDLGITYPHVPAVHPSLQPNARPSVFTCPRCKGPMATSGISMHNAEVICAACAEEEIDQTWQQELADELKQAEIKAGFRTARKIRNKYA